MLTPGAYVTACVIYVLSAFVATAVAYRSWLSNLPLYPARMVTGLLLGLLFVPAQPSAGSETLAPALVIAIFNTVFGEGWATARQAVVLLGIAGILGVVSGAITALILGDRSTRIQSDTGRNPDADGP